MFELFIYPVLGYFIGSIPVGYILVKIQSEKDIRDYGSGGIGASNVSRVQGLKWGIVIVVFDILKAVIPLLIIKNFLTYDALYHYTLCGTGLAIILGHIYPIFLGFKGGKGVATFIGTIITLLPVEACVYLILYVLLLTVTRYTSLTSIITVSCFPIIIFLFQGTELTMVPYVLFAILTAVIIILKHKENIKRLINGSEHRFSLKKKRLAK